MRSPADRPLSLRRDPPLPTAAARPPIPNRLKKESSISPTKADPERDNLIREITVDRHDEDQQLIGFENAFDEANLPYPGAVVGEDVEILSVSTATNRRELIATCQRAGKRYEIALLDINITQTPTPHA